MVSWPNNKELSIEADTISWKSLKKKTTGYKYYAYSAQRKKKVKSQIILSKLDFFSYLSLEFQYFTI